MEGTQKAYAFCSSAFSTRAESIFQKYVYQYTNVGVTFSEILQRLALFNKEVKDNCLEQVH